MSQTDQHVPDCSHVRQLQPPTVLLTNFPTMTSDKVIATEHELEDFDLNDPRTLELIQRAQDADAADKQLTIRQALKKYKKAVLWAALLSVSLIMEGYDLVMVRRYLQMHQLKPRRDCSPTPASVS